MKLLVTGGAGFIGSNFIRYWLNKYLEDSIFNLDLLTYAGSLENLKDVAEKYGSRYDFALGSIIDTDFIDRLVDQFQPDVIVNFAAESHNSRAILNPTIFFQTNLIGTQTLLQIAHKHNVSHFHHISTCEVYGDLALDSDATFNELSPYSVTISICANNYGPYQNVEKLIPLFTTRAICNQPLTLYRSSQNKREWLAVEDHCRAIDLVIRSGKRGEKYNIGSGVEKSVEEIAEIVLRTLNKPNSLKTYVPDRPGHDRRYLLDSTKVRRELGWQPEIDFEDGLRDTIAWYVDNPRWWQAAQHPQIREDQWASKQKPNS